MTYPASPIADVTVSTAAAINAQLDAWEANWAGTVPAGKTTADERMIALDTSTAANVDLANRTFPQMVWLRSAGTFTDYDCSVKFTGGASGQLDMTGSTKLGLYLLHVCGAERVRINQTTSCAVTRCFLQAVDTSSPTTFDFGTSGGYALDVENGVISCQVEDCLIGWASTGLYMHSGNIDNLVVKGCVFDWCGNDSLKNTSNLTNFTLENCWLSRNQRDAIGTAKHEDGFQQHGGYTDTAYIRGNVGLLDSNRRYGGTDGSWQVLFWGDAFPCYNGTFEQNILASNNGGIKWGTGPNESGNIARNNTCVQIAVPPSYACNINFGTRSRNWTMNRGNDADNGAGTDGISVYVGPDYYAKDLSVADTYFKHGCPVEGDPIGHYEPEPGTDMHWDFSGTPVGAGERFEELFSLGGSYVPGNVGWPLAGTFEDVFNDIEPKIPTTYDGTYTADGENGGTITPAAPSIPGTPTIIGTPNVGQILTFIASTPVTGYPAPTRTWEVYNSVSGLVQTGASNQYQLQASDQGDQIYARQKETNTEGEDTAQSANTGTIGAALSAPTVSAFFPLDNATGVPVTATFTVTFDQDVQFGAGTISLWRAGVARETWNVATNVGTGPHTVSISGAVLTIDTFSNMLLDADYSIHIDNGAIESLTGAAFPGFSDDTTWNWSTGSTPVVPNMGRRMTASIFVE